MIQYDRIDQYLYWATKRPVPPVFQNSYLNGVVHFMAWRLLKGTLVINFPNQAPQHYEAGCWIFHEASGGIQNFSADAELISIRFDLLYENGIPLFSRKKTVVIHEEEGAKLSQNADELITLLDRWRVGDTRYVDRDTIPLDENFRLESIFCAWVAEYIRLMQQHGQEITVDHSNDPRVNLAMQLLNQHEPKEKLQESQIASQCNLSLNRLNTLFHEHMGMTLGEFYAARRLRLAAHLLLKTPKPIKEIAFELGFSSPAHFSNWFADRQNISPREYRRQAPRD